MTEYDASDARSYPAYSEYAGEQCESDESCSADGTSSGESIASDDAYQAPEVLRAKYGRPPDKRPDARKLADVRVPDAFDEYFVWLMKVRDDMHQMRITINEANQKIDQTDPIAMDSLAALIRAVNAERSRVNLWLQKHPDRKPRARCLSQCASSACRYGPFPDGMCHCYDNVPNFPMSALFAACREISWRHVRAVDEALTAGVLHLRDVEHLAGMRLRTEIARIGWRYVICDGKSFERHQHKLPGSVSTNVEPPTAYQTNFKDCDRCEIICAHLPPTNRPGDLPPPSALRLTYRGDICGTPESFVDSHFAAWASNPAARI